MRKVVIHKPTHIAPFNESARLLRVLNKPLWQWHRDLLAPYCTGEVVVSSLRDISSNDELLVYSDNLWFDEPFLVYFLQEAHRRKKAVRAAFHASDPAFLQQGLRTLTRSYEQRGDLVFVDLWYFPSGPTDQVEAVIIPSGAREVGYYHFPDHMRGQNDDLVWWLPERAVCAVDTWVHVFFINIVFGIFTYASRFEQTKVRNPLFRIGALWRAFFERKDLLASSAYVKIGKNCSIDTSTVFRGPVYIGDNVTIGPGCVLSQCLVGNNVTLTHGNHFHMSVISDGCFFPWGASAYFTIFMEGTSVGQNTSLEMSVIGRNTYVGGGSVFASVNLLPGPLQAIIDGQHPIDLNMPVLGGCVGHNCRLGPGLIVYPARMIESDVMLIASPTRRVIMNNISYEESDHHALYAAEAHPRLYPRQEEMR